MSNVWCRIAAVYPHFKQLTLLAASPVKGFRGRRTRGRKWPPTVVTEKELHIEPRVPTEDIDEVSKLSSIELDTGKVYFP